MREPTATHDLIAAAAVAGDWDRVLAMTTAGGALQAADEDGATLLHLALHQNRIEVAAVLLARGADAQAVDLFGRTPLHYLAETADADHAVPAADLVAVLTAPAGAATDPNAMDLRGRTPLHAAAVRGLPPVVAALLAAGALVNQPKRDGQTALHLAVARQHGAVVELLLKHGADPDLPAKDGLSPRALAAKFAYGEMLARLGQQA